MPQREVIIKGGPNKTAAFVTGKEELLVRLGSEAVGLATESTLQSVLTTLQAFTEYEAKFVVDANNEIFLEVRVWNEDTGTWSGTPTYYRPGETTVASPAPVAPITYADSTPILNNILTELQSITHSEDTPHVSGNNGVMALGVRNDLDAVLTSNDGDYSPIAVTDTGAVKIDGTIAVALEGFADAGNSSTTPLLAGATFTGTAIDIKDYAAINVAAFSNVDSAVDGLKMQFSPDGVNWDHTHSFSVTGNVGVSYAQAAELRYFRIVYVNGGTNQTSFRLTTILKLTTVSPSRYTVEQSLVGTQMADVVKSVIFGKTTAGGGGYVDVKVNPSGALTVESASSTLDGTGNAITSTTVGADTGLDVNIIGGTTPLPVSVSGEVEVINAVGSPIPVTVVAPVPVIQVNLDAADDQVGVYGYVNGVSTTPTPLNVDANGQVAIQDGGSSITVDSPELTSIANSVSPLVTVTPNILISSNDPVTVLNVAIYSITFFNNGTTTVDISMDSGTTTAGIPAGVSITMEAGGIKNIYESGVFVIGDTTASGASMIVTYNT